MPFSGSYNDLTNKPTIATDVACLTDTTNRIPTLLTQLNISDGTVGQVLTTDGSGNFTFSTLAQSGGDTQEPKVETLQVYRLLVMIPVALTVAGNNTLKFEGAGTITTTAPEVSGTTVLTISRFRQQHNLISANC